MDQPSLSGSANQSTLNPGNGFSSFKTGSPIRYRGRWPLDALIQLTLDPIVQQIRVVPEQDGVTQSRLLLDIRLTGARELHCLTEEQSGKFDCPPDFDRAMYVPKAEVLAEPRLMFTRTIWSCRRKIVPANALKEILTRIGAQDGTVPAVVLTNGQRIEHLFALACAGIIDLTWRYPTLELLSASIRPRILSTSDNEGASKTR